MGIWNKIFSKEEKVKETQPNRNTYKVLEKYDAYFIDAGRKIVEQDKVSVGMIQRLFKINYDRAATILNQLYESGVVSAEEGTKPRRVLMEMHEFDLLLNYIDNHYVPSNKQNSTVINMDNEPRKQTISRKYYFPPIELLSDGRIVKVSDDMLRKNAVDLQKFLYNTGLPAEVTNVTVGFCFICYEIIPKAGVQAGKIKRCTSDFKRILLSEEIRIVIPMKGNSSIGILARYAPNSSVSLKHFIGYKDLSSFNKLIGIGANALGERVFVDFSKQLHMLISGTSCSGKSNLIHSIIMSILFYYSPMQAKMMIIDSKACEYSCYNNLPHMLIPIINDMKKGLGVLDWVKHEIDIRANLIASNNAANISEYNSIDNREKLPDIYIIIDDYYNLATEYDPEFCSNILSEILMYSQDLGIHLIISTSSPRACFLSEKVKCNIQNRISFMTASSYDSQAILGMSGAEHLFQTGDMLVKFQNDQSKACELQSIFVSQEEIYSVTEYIYESNNLDNLFTEDIIPEVECLKNAKEILEYLKKNKSIPEELIGLLETLVAAERVYGSMKRSAIEKIRLYLTNENS